MLSSRRPGILWLCYAVALLAATGLARGSEEDDDLGEFSKVTIGSVIKLTHVASGFRIHSHEVKWGSGSGQQSVTAVDDAADPNSLWVVKCKHGSHCAQGTPVLHGHVVRCYPPPTLTGGKSGASRRSMCGGLSHLQTKRNLHSHTYKSPLSQRQEVSCYGEQGEGDTGDDWIIETMGQADWTRNKSVRFKHYHTGAFLTTGAEQVFNQRNCGGNCPIAGQLEVSAVKKANDPQIWWQATEGVFFPEKEETPK